MPAEASQEPVAPQSPRRAARFSVAFIPVALRAVDYLMSVTGLSKTDVINRSVQIYQYLEERKHEGYEVYLRDADGNVERLRIM